jgi:hypothetical protein
MDKNEKEILATEYKTAYRKLKESENSMDEYNRRYWSIILDFLKSLMLDLGYTERQLNNLVKNIK